MNVVSRKTVTRCLLLTAIVFGCVVDSSKILRYQSQLAQKQSTKSADQERQTAEESRVVKVQSDSDKAMIRAQSGCVKVILTQNNRPARFNGQLRIFDSQTFPTDPKTPRFDKLGNPINGVQPMPSGVTVCNEFGDTALITEGGYLTEIYRVEPNKLTEFRSLIK